MLCAAIRQRLFCQNVMTENSSNFPFVKVSQYTAVDLSIRNYCVIGPEEAILYWLGKIQLTVNLLI